MARRTNKQIQHDNYCKDVDQYQYFILRLSDNKILTGFELKQDAAQEQIDNDNKTTTKILSRRQAAKIDININQLLNQWKQC